MTKQEKNKIARLAKKIGKASGKMYLDLVINLTIEYLAEYYGISQNKARKIVQDGREIHNKTLSN